MGLTGLDVLTRKKKEKRKKEKSLLECVHDEWVNGKKTDIAGWDDLLEDWND